MALPAAGGDVGVAEGRTDVVGRSDTVELIIIRCQREYGITYNIRYHL